MRGKGSTSSSSPTVKFLSRQAALKLPAIWKLSTRLVRKPSRSARGLAFSRNTPTRSGRGSSVNCSKVSAQGSRLRNETQHRDYRTLGDLFLGQRSCHDVAL